MKKIKSSAVRPQFTNTRKAIRKVKRKQKKINRQEHYLRKKIQPVPAENTPGKFVKRPIDDPVLNKESKKKKCNTETSQDILLRQLKKEKNEANKLKSQMYEQRMKMMLEANEEEDKMIKKLEKQLGLNKSKNKNNFFANDGLDYLLEVCDRTTSEQIVAAEKHLADVDYDSDFERDLAVVASKDVPKKKSKDMAQEDGNEMTDDMEDVDSIQNSDDDNDGDDLDDSEINDDDYKSEASDDIYNKTEKESKNKTNKKSDKEKVISEDDINKVFSEDEVSHLSGDDSSENNELENKDETSYIEDEEKPNVWEDIYGRKRDKEGNVIKEEKGIYIPPHLRNKDSTSDKDLLQLKRQIKSVLNKLAGTNLHWACTSIESLYSNNSRNSVNTALSQLWLEAVVGVSATPDRMVAEHAALVAVLHANVGSEIGAHFLEVLSQRFSDTLRSPQPIENKTLDNLVACLALLFSFKIYHACLLYDILTRLVDELTEKHIDCVLTALRNVGGVLRKEEPAALRTFIQDTQAKIAGVSETAANGSRIKFLLEVLLAVKNNNLNKIPNYDPTYVENLKKMCRGAVRKGNYVTTLNIRLEDLLKAHERGKWWVVGSAWEGTRPLLDKPTATVPSADQKLLELARKQRMNTDVRRSIFCVIMAAEDYMDAFEKLQHLGLRGQQQREVVHVLLACCLQEKTYNPYYGVLGQKLCDTDRRYQLSIQYTVWDRIKDLQSLPKLSVSNLAQFLIHLIVQKGLPLSILKIIEFSDLNKTSVRFMRQILLAIITNDDLQASLDVFHRISKPPKLRMFRESLRLFVQHFLIKNAGKKTGLSDGEMAKLRERVVDIDRILTTYENKLRL